MFARFARAVALLLFAAQAIVAQAHVHAPARWSGAITAHQLDVRPAPPPQRSGDPLDCPVCREIAHAGAYLSPGPLTFDPPAAAEPWTPVASLPSRFHGQRSHFWRSRAPPVLLSA